MAETVYRLDGSVDVFFTEKSVYLERLICEKLGDDVARLFWECIEELEEAKRLEEERANEQERIAEEHFLLCQDACDSFESLTIMLEQPGSHRKVLKTLAQNGYNLLKNNL